ncbi:MAG TPA: class I SAM-dependent methyltransferase [Candidatus Moranbacteria bacterium]|nr:class I SAM-dependent methyltransferase [Candidatus Moranbacteria bacterium]
MIIYTLPTKAFGGEFNETDDKYQAFLQRVSAEAKIKNLEEAQRRLSSQKNGTDIGKMLYKMGRDPSHFSSPHFDGVSELCHRVKVGAAGFKSLDIFYNWKEKYKPNLDMNNTSDRVADLWIGGMENRQAVSNRQKIVINELVQAINIVDGKEARIFSLAGGDGQTIIKAIKKVGKKVKVLLVDPDREALQAAKKNVEEAGLADSFVIKRGLASTAKKLARDFRPHIFDVVGLLDYLDDGKVIEIIATAKRSLCQGGVLLTCNIINNKEREFLENVLLWDMIYRNPEKLGTLIAAGGFNSDNVKIICEPFKIHAVAVCLNL